MVGDFFQIIKRVKPSGVAVTPDGLKRITADRLQPPELERGWRQGLIRPFVQISQDIHFSLAAGARAMAPQFFQWHKTLAAIVPFDGELVANCLNIRRPHEPRDYSASTEPSSRS